MTALNSSSSAKVSKRPETAEIAEIADSENPVGRLQEVAQSRYWPLPMYSFGGQEGLDGHFTCTARLRQWLGSGIGGSKRQAKRRAAAQLLRLIESAPTSKETPASKTTPTSKETPTLKPTPTSKETPTLKPTPTLKETPTSKPTPTSKETPASKVTPTSKKAPTSKETSTSSSRTTPTSEARVGAEVAFAAASASEQLLELGRLHKFGVQFLDKGSRAHGPGCAVKLATMPTIVAVGCGADPADSRERACRAALEYLADLCSLESQTPMGSK